MKLRLLALLLIISILLPGCLQLSPADIETTVPTGDSAPTTEATEPTVPSTEPSTQATEPPTEPPTEPTEPEPEIDAKMLPMGDVYITAGAITKEYGQAQLEAVWSDGSIENQTIEIKLRGHSSDWSNKKSYNIKFTEKQPFMGMSDAKRWSLLANPLDKSLLRAVMGFDLAERIGLPWVSDTRLCKVHLNGTYMGVYVAIEPIQDKKDRVDIDVKAGDAIFEKDVKREEKGDIIFSSNAGLRFKLDEPGEATQAQIDAYVAFLNNVEQAVSTFDYDVYSQYIDVPSFVDFYIFHEIIKDIDFAQYSTRYVLKDGILYAGPPWDLDLTQGNVSMRSQEWHYMAYHNRNGYGNNSGDSTQEMWIHRDYYIWLCEDPYFMNLVRARWQEIKPIAETMVWETEAGPSRLDQYIAAHRENLESNYNVAGWSVSKPTTAIEYNKPAADYMGNVEILRTWLQKRIAWLDTALTPQNPE